MAFADTAPIAASLGITQTQADNYFANLPAQPAAPVEPTLTKAKYVEVANLLYDGLHGIEKHNGILGIARATGLTTVQVKSVVNELTALKALNDQNN